nr:hypothetical protein [uncultured Cohaesibacter sp.]
MRYFFILPILLMPFSAFASDLPDYDSETYCTDYATDPNGSYAKDIFDPCLTSEYFSEAMLEDQWDKLDKDAKVRCDAKARADEADRHQSGSYSLLKQCLEAQK